jgi:hypothetical protein
MKLEERSALDWRFTDRNPHDNRADRAATESSRRTACKGQGQDRPCRARPADRSLVAADRSAAGIRDPTGPEELPRRIRGLPTRRWSPRTGLTLWTSWEPSPPRARWSFSSAVPPACHKQRARTVSSGQSRSLETTVGLGASSLTWGGGGGRNCMACKGSTRGSTLPCRPAGRRYCQARVEGAHAGQLVAAGGDMCSRWMILARTLSRDVRSEPSHEAQKASESALALRGRRITVA